MDVARQVFVRENLNGAYNYWHSHSMYGHFSSATDWQQRGTCKKHTVLLRVPCSLQVYGGCFVCTRKGLKTTVAVLTDFGTEHSP